ncbi:envelope protein [Tylonycteris bat coronavirus HKU33]|uniref:Envelope small membrane protein n=1 Tax=Tylonycteris bat coronavirus HKU33 TaxID=2586420 RepID=A0AAE6F8Y2_9ALPC|nr:envelope protein [Tylonycteris bat coronavirus HKU33]QCX35162.1 envelope protein [Tylonycteris bat coronavirus HKU33]UUT43911.1 envelope protein [Tylonycteris robustula coronavirus]
MFLRLVKDDGFVVNAILWVFLLIFILLLCITFIKLVQMCMVCHHLMSGAVYRPVYRVYELYKDFMRIDPAPILDV